MEVSRMAKRKKRKSEQGARAVALAERAAAGAFADRQHRRRDLLLASGVSPAEAEARTAGVIVARGTNRGELYETAS
jgi:hypothetical protein